MPRAAQESEPGEAPVLPPPGPVYPAPPPPRPWVPRIGGTAMPGGVHFSSGNYGTGPNYLLFLTGVSILGLGAVAMTLAYVVTWLVGYLIGLPLADSLMGLPILGVARDLVLAQIGIYLLTFMSFLVVLRASPMSGYHGAEHKVVHCLETYGVLDRALARSCPRAHRRCGTVLLSGFLPLPFIAIPLLSQPYWGLPAAVAVVFVGWMLRFRVGFWIQNVFTTKEPTEHQLGVALRAAELLLERWRRDPYLRLPLWRAIWVRGYPQMVAGVIVATQILGWLRDQLPFWLDFTHVLR